MYACMLQMLVLRTMTTVLELLAALCLVKGGHEKIMAGVDTFKVVRLRHCCCVHVMVEVYVCMTWH